MKNNREIYLLLSILIIMPAIILGLLIIKYSVNVIFLDEFRVAKYIYQYFTNGNITFQDLIAQQHESRPLFPRLIFIGLASLTQWDIRYEMLITFLLACLISFNIYRLNKLSWGDRIYKLVLVTLIINVLIFSPIQYENWLWGIQIIVFIPMACITCCLVFLYSKINKAAQLFVCIALSTISTFSYANGLLCWIIISPVIALKNSRQLNQSKWLGIVWIASFIFNLTLYFYDYRPLSNRPSLLYAIFHPLLALDYFFCFLGAPFAYSQLNTARLIGIVFVLIFSIVCAYLVKFRNDYILWHKTICWLMIGSYTIMSAIITTIGRVELGVGQSFAGRYSTFSLYLPIALIPLILIVLDDAIQKGLLSKYKQLISGIIFLLSGYLIVMQMMTSMLALAQMNVWRTERLQGKSCLLFINVVKEEECLAKKAHPRIDEFKVLIEGLDKIGLIKPGLIKSSKIQNIESKEKVTIDDYGYGWFDHLKKEKDNTYNAWGWARLPAREEPADVVILTYEDTPKRDIVFAISDSRIERPDVAKVTQKNGYLMSGWQKSFSAHKLPKGQVKIKAWAFDSDTGKAFKLNGGQILQNP